MDCHHDIRKMLSSRRGQVVEHLNVIEDIRLGQIPGFMGKGVGLICCMMPYYGVTE